jgi:hypothetical protein
VEKKTLAAPASSATASTWPVVSALSQAAAGRLANSSAEIRSQVIISGRAGNRSTQAPAGRPITSHGRYAAAVSTATAKVLACSTVTASSGTPTVAIELPAPLIVSPVHSRKKFRWRSTPPR